MTSYIERLRLDIALVLLRTRSYTVAEVADAVGFAYVQTFYRAFHKQFGCTPGSTVVLGDVKADVSRSNDDPFEPSAHGTKVKTVRDSGSQAEPRLPPGL